VTELTNQNGTATLRYQKPLQFTALPCPVLQTCLTDWCFAIHQNSSASVPFLLLLIFAAAESLNKVAQAADTPRVSLYCCYFSPACRQPAMSMNPHAMSMNLPPACCCLLLFPPLHLLYLLQTCCSSCQACLLLLLLLPPMQLLIQHMLLLPPLLQLLVLVHSCCY
jgi:hypothetical protein